MFSPNRPHPKGKPVGPTAAPEFFIQWWRDRTNPKLRWYVLTPALEMTYHGRKSWTLRLSFIVWSLQIGVGRP